MLCKCAAATNRTDSFVCFGSDTVWQAPFHQAESLNGQPLSELHTTVCTCLGLACLSRCAGHRVIGHQCKWHCGLPGSNAALCGTGQHHLPAHMWHSCCSMQVLPEMSLEDTALFYARAAAGAHDASIAAYKVRCLAAAHFPSLAGC